VLAHDPVAQAILARVVDALHALVGSGATIRAERRSELLPAASGKFRLAHRIG